MGNAGRRSIPRSLGGEAVLAVLDAGASLAKISNCGKRLFYGAWAG
jgi:hypothetical protein